MQRLLLESITRVKRPRDCVFALQNTSPSSMLPQQFQFLICTETCETVRVMKYQIAATCCFCLSLLFYLPLLFDQSTTSAAEHVTSMPSLCILINIFYTTFLLALSNLHHFSHSLNCIRYPQKIIPTYTTNLPAQATDLCSDMPNFTQWTHF